MVDAMGDMHMRVLAEFLVEDQDGPMPEMVRIVSEQAETYLREHPQPQDTVDFDLTLILSPGPTRARLVCWDREMDLFTTPSKKAEVTPEMVRAGIAALDPYLDGGYLSFCQAEAAVSDVIEAALLKRTHKEIDDGQQAKNKGGTTACD